MFRGIVLWLLNVFFVVICAESVPIRETSLGVLEGYYMKTRSGRLISAFTAIPYAVPPVGELRFMPPVPVQPWEGILNASKVAPICVQRNPYTRQKEIVGQEDCLYLNIYSPYIGNVSNIDSVTIFSILILFRKNINSLENPKVHAS
ncbi:unnamed protein product [Euphydryas editha]|uniref:Carboxylesterase type B domain-containing protein n=1 Tax=Euphydryas editha TaxID=104508 RepID=A0AAU9V026_EUPED|nr:unnamed protein product [Euphydryas editha]